MSGGHFDYNEHWIGEIANTIERDIATALLPKPALRHYDYWTIDVVDTPHSKHLLARGGSFTFPTYEEALDYLKTRIRWIKKSNKQKYGIGSIISDEDNVFESQTEFMTEEYKGKKIPILYTIHHSVYDDYPFDNYPLLFDDKTIEILKEGYKQIKIAEIYAKQIDLVMSNETGEDTLQEYIQADLDNLESEIKSKDWTNPYEGWNEND